MNSEIRHHSQTERVLSLAALAVEARSDEKLLECQEEARRELELHDVADASDLGWWIASGHRLKPTASIKWLPLYILYKAISYAFKVDLDAGIEPRPAYQVMREFAADGSSGLYLTIILERDAMYVPETSLAKAAGKLLNEFEQGDLSGLGDFLTHFREADASSVIRWIMLHGILGGPHHFPFLPFIGTDEIPNRWHKPLAESYQPYLRIIAGLDRCQLICHWYNDSLVMFPRNRESMQAHMTPSSTI